jgi:hypothetical protein
MGRLVFERQQEMEEYHSLVTRTVGKGDKWQERECYEMFGVRDGM